MFAAVVKGVSPVGAEQDCAGECEERPALGEGWARGEDGGEIVGAADLEGVVGSFFCLFGSVTTAKARSGPTSFHAGAVGL